MWNAVVEAEHQKVQKMSIFADKHPLCFRDVLTLLQEDEAFRSFFSKIFIDIPFQGYRWETPALVGDTLKHPFECVFIDTPSLQREQSKSAFSEHFSQVVLEDVVSFHNLRKDAFLVVPTPRSEFCDYAHLASFVRTAPEVQKSALWAAAAKATLERVGDVPLWLSTAGMGVPWLHIRLDSRPKYYAYGPYKSRPGGI